MEAHDLVRSWFSECGGVLHDSKYPLVVFALAFNYSGKVLTFHDQYDGVRLPGGPLKFEESTGDAVTRCVWEQCGLIVRAPTVWDVVAAGEVMQDRCVTFHTLVNGATSKIRTQRGAWLPSEEVLAGVYGPYNATYLGDMEDEWRSGKLR